MLIVPRPNRHRFLYFVRHGQYQRTAAHPDGTLTELGRFQASALGAALRDVPVDTIWSSTMYRAEETAQIMVDRYFRNLTVSRSNLLREKLFPCDREYWATAPPDKRAPEDRLDRIAERWLRRSNRERHEVVVCHGNVIRAVVTRALGSEIGNWVRMGSFNCGLTRIACWGDGRVSVLSYNETGHLPPNCVTVG